MRKRQISCWQRVREFEGQRPGLLVCWQPDINVLPCLLLIFSNAELSKLQACDLCLKLPVNLRCIYVYRKSICSKPLLNISLSRGKIMLFTEHLGKISEQQFLSEGMQQQRQQQQPVGWVRKLVAVLREKVFRKMLIQHQYGV